MKYNDGLSENEWYIMQVLWEHSPATLREICDALKTTKGWTKYAVTSFLNRMLDKGAIAVDAGGKVRTYSPVWDQKDTIRTESRSILERVYRGNPLLMVNSAVREQKLSKKEIAELKELLDRLDE